jgi:ABC-type branched-subunit amino acid transport system substrate-binding protein
VKLAVDQINKRGPFTVAGKQYRLQLFQQDTRSDPTVAATAGPQLVRDNQVVVMFGTVFDTGLPVIPTAQKAGVIQFMGSTAVEKELDKTENCCLFRSVISTKYRDPLWLKGMVDAVHTADPTLKTMAFVFPNSQTNQLLVNGWAGAAQATGMDVIAKKYYTPGTTDFSSVLSSLASQHPDVIFGSYLTPDAQAILRAAVEQGIGKAFMFPAVSTDIAAQTLGHTIAQPVIVPFTGAQFYLPATQKIRDYITLYKGSRGGSLPTGSPETSLFFYDSVGQWVSALQQAGCVPVNDGSGLGGASDCTKKVVSTLTSKPYDGVRGPIQYDSTHRVKYPIDVCITITSTTTCKSYTP